MCESRAHLRAQDVVSLCNTLFSLQTLSMSMDDSLYRAFGKNVWKKQ